MMNVTELDFEHVSAEAAEVVRARGEIDLTNADSVKEAIAVTTSSVVVLELTGVTFLDSAGIRAIDGAIKSLRASGRALYVVAPAESRAGWTFRVAGFSDDVVLDSLDAVPGRVQV